MKSILKIALGIIAALGGFLDIGDQTASSSCLRRAATCRSPPGGPADPGTAF